MGWVIILVVFVSLAANLVLPFGSGLHASNTMWNGINRFSKEFNVQKCLDSVAAYWRHRK